MGEEGIRSGMAVSSDHWTRRCSRRALGKAEEKARRFARLDRFRSGGKGRGDSVGVGKMSNVEDMSFKKTSAGLASGSIKAGHSSNVFRISIS